MYAKIKKLADDALALQNKDAMDMALREISATAGNMEWPGYDSTKFPSAMTADQFEAAELAHHKATKVTYGAAKGYDTEAEMIADIQGAPSPVFPLPESVTLKDGKGGKVKAQLVKLEKKAKK